MKKRAAWILLLAMILSALAWVSLRPPGVKQPVYDGKPLSYWLDQALNRPGPRLISTGSAPVEVQAVMRNFGTNAIPWLMQEVSAHEPDFVSSAKSKINRLTKMHLLTAAGHHERAQWALRALGEAGGLAVTRGLTNSDKWIRLGCVNQFSAGTMYSGMYVSVLLGRLKDPDAEVRARATSVIAIINYLNSTDKHTTSALTEALHDSNGSVRAMAALGLACVGKPQQVGVPILFDCLTISQANLESFASNALKSIGPTTATNLSPLRAAFEEPPNK